MEYTHISVQQYFGCAHPTWILRTQEQEGTSCSWVGKDLQAMDSVQFSCSVVSDSLRPHESQHARTSCPSPTPGVHSDPRPLSRWCHPAISSSIVIFSNESTLCMRWPKYWSFSFSIIPSKEIPGLISFRMDWLDLLAVQGTLKSHIALEN